MYTKHTHTKHFCLTVEGISRYLPTHCFIPLESLSSVWIIQMSSLHSSALVTWLHVRIRRQPIAVALPTRCKRWERQHPHLLLRERAPGTHTWRQLPLPPVSPSPPPHSPSAISLRLGSHWLTYALYLHKRWRLCWALSTLSLLRWAAKIWSMYMGSEVGEWPGRVNKMLDCIF